MTATTLDKGKTVAGKALYLEFQKSDYTVQIIFIPEVMETTGKVIPSNFMYRRPNSYQARKNWHFNPSRQGVTLLGLRKTEGNKYSQIPLESAMEFSSKAWANAQGYLNSLFHQDYLLNKAPIVVEITWEEIYEVASAKTSTGLMRRINRSRDAKNFGDLVVKTVPTTV
jgi:hypothetical protein